MIYTLQKWPDVMTTLLRLFTDNETIVLKESEAGLVLCKQNEFKLLPLQESVSLFLSQPSARRDFSKHALDKYDHFVVNLKKGHVLLATAEQAKPFIDATLDNEKYCDALLEIYKDRMQLMMRHWINAQMEYLPLDDDECVIIYPMRARTG